jgi:hypothetical protein
MNWRDLAIIKQLALSVISFTGLMVVIVGFSLMLSVFKEPDLSRVSRVPSSISNVVFLDGASDSPQHGQQKLREDIHLIPLETLAMGCIKDQFEVSRKSSAQHLRLLGQLCLGSPTLFEKSSIINRTNGFEATLFRLQGNQFSTDYMPLAYGENQLFIELESHTGERVIATIRVDRDR